MEFEERIEDIEKKLHEKGINIETQDYIIKYVYMNQKLFGRILNIDKLVDRIVNNLEDNIISIDTKRNPVVEMIRISTTNGAYFPYDKRIMINPINKIRSFLFERQKQRNDSTIMHEIDHCATTEYADINEQEKEYYIQKYLERKQVGNKKIENKIRSKVDKILKKYNGKLAISGIVDYRYVIENGIGLRALNEGITAYKQEMYDKFLGNKPHTSYKAEKNVAKFIADVIGNEELINLHFNNDYEGIRIAFHEKTGKDLNELVKRLNRKSMIKTMAFGEVYTRSFCKKMEMFLEGFEVKKEQKTKADFVPKFNADYTSIAKIMQESELQQCEINREIVE